jgi:hypothetical protein
VDLFDNGDGALDDEVDVVRDVSLVEDVITQLVRLSKTSRDHLLDLSTAPILKKFAAPENLEIFPPLCQLWADEEERKR